LFDVAAVPEEAAAGAKVDDRLGEVGIAFAVDGDGAAAGETEELGDGM
jgi:hypothetical protein